MTGCDSLFNQLALHHPFFALFFADLTQLGAGHQQTHFDLLPDVVVFTRLGAEGQGGIVLRLGSDGVAARRHLLEDIAVGHRIAYGKAIHQHRHLDGSAEGLVAIDIEVGRILGCDKLLGLGVSGGIGHGDGSTTGKQGRRQQGSTHHYLPEHGVFLSGLTGFKGSHGAWLPGNHSNRSRCDEIQYSDN